MKQVTAQGVSLRSFGVADMFVAGLVPLLLLLQQGMCAPQIQAGSQRSESAEGSSPLTLANPFGSSEEDRSLLQSYIQANLREGQASPDVNTWEQEVFFLFSLHDYDKSGQLDGLEVMQLLSDFLSHSQTPKSTDQVVAMVDFLLQTQDLNQDGLLAPTELLSPPMQQQKQGEVDAKGSSVSDDAPAKPAEEAPQQEAKAEADGEPPQEPKQDAQQPRDPAAEDQQNQIHKPAPGQQNRQQEVHQQQQQRQVPVHKGQPEM